VRISLLTVIWFFSYTRNEVKDEKFA